MFFILPATLISILRGNVGTDTFTYLNYFRALNLSDDLKFEPGFEFLSRFLKIFLINERLILSLISFLIILLIVRAFSYTKEQIVLFSILLFPLFFYDMTMSALRYGLGFSISMYSIHNLNRFKFKTAVILGLLAIIIQYSCILILSCFFLFKLKKFYILITICFFSLALFLLNFNFSYFYEKQDFYKDTVSPSATSGLGPLLVFIALTFLYFLSFKNSGQRKILLLIVIFELLSFLVAKISYAGLRLQMLFLFTLIIFLKEELIFLQKKNLFFYSLFLMGMFSLFLNLKNISLEIENNAYPFLPYKFFWQEN
jgi:hypothetical protein